jgi:hypothetical protein
MNHLTRFQQFVEELSKSGKWHDFLSDSSSGLSKTKLVAATGIPRSSFYQSEDLAAEVAKIEIKLRRAGVLKAIPEMPSPISPEIEVIELIGSLDRLHERLRVLEDGKEALNRRLAAIVEQIEPYKIGMTK